MNLWQLILESLKARSIVSSMRVNVYWILSLATFLVLCLGWNLLHNTQTKDYDWIGASAFLASITALIATALVGKTQQKKTEIKQTKDEGNS